MRDYGEKEYIYDEKKWSMERSNSAKELQKFFAGYAVIDDTLDGIDRFDIIILGARVGMWKTAFALDVAYALATTAKKENGAVLTGCTVFYISLFFRVRLK